MPNSYRTCSVEGCEGKHDARGLCTKHYGIFRKESPIAFCSVEGCNNKHEAKGYCTLHFQRLRKHGDVTVCKKWQALKFIEDTAENPPDDCVIWPFGTSLGYGHVRYKGKTVKAHRLALVFYSGENPGNLYALHGPCNNPSCINPKHLRWGTLAENVLDAILAGNMKGLFPEEVRQVRSLLATKSVKEIAVSFGVSISTIYDIKNGKTRKCVK